MKNLNKFIGQKFVRLTVMERIFPNVDGRTQWKCLCDCGKTKITRASYVLSGTVKSCGCLLHEPHKETRHKTHGISKTPTYRSWIAMMQRCLNPKAIGYDRYKAFKPCEFLKASPINLEFVLGPKSDASLTLDRIENKDGYHCGQCEECLTNSWKLNIRWATKTEQNRNRTYNRVIVINGVSKLMIDWAREFKVHHSTISDRVKKGYYGEQPEPAKN